MSHTDPERLVLLALGKEEPARDETEHLRGCADCTREYAAMRAVADLGRETQDEQDLPPVPERVWERIAAETGQPNTGQAPPPAASVGEPTGPIGLAASVGEPAGPAGGPPAPVDLASRRPRRALQFVAVAAASAALGAGGAVVVDRLGSGPAAPAERVVARAELAPQAAAPAGARGTVQIVQTPDGQRLRLRLGGMPAPDGLYEIWLYDGRASMIPLGVLADAGSADVAVPRSIDVTSYPIVDVSAQRVGQQEHGQSMLQGKLG